MDQDGGKNNEQDKKSPIALSLRIELLAAIIGMISDAISIWALLEAIEEVKKAEEEGAEAQNELNDLLANMQGQIDQLTKELNQLKANQCQSKYNTDSSHCNKEYRQTECECKHCYRLDYTHSSKKRNDPK